MRGTDYVVIATICVLSLLFVTDSAKHYHKSHNDVIPKHKGNKYNSKTHNKEKPWLLLPNHNQCFKDWCKSSKDCCRGYNICDPSAKVCINCWYAYPCKTSANCCENYPVCSKEPGQVYGGCKLR